MTGVLVATLATQTVLRHSIAADGWGDAAFQGGLALLPLPVDGKPGLVVMNGSGAASRGTRWYAGDGPPPSEGLNPPPAPGDLYLNRVNGQVFELIV